MILFPNCKINLGLHILRKRSDGYHDLETVFYPVPLNDALEIVQSKSGTHLHTTGIEINSPPESNICIKAYYLLKERFPELPAVEIHLHKAIPSGAGLGGGSADGAFMLMLLNKRFGLNLSDSELLKLALQLGSDCPFFIKNQPCFAKGRGEDLTTISLDLSGYFLVLVNPGIHVSTGWAFSQIHSGDDREPLRDVVQLPVGDWKEKLSNGFEPAIIEHYPEIARVKELLYNQGAIYVSMSGSGSTVYALFETQQQRSPDLPEDYFYACLLLK